MSGSTTDSGAYLRDINEGFLAALRDQCLQLGRGDIAAQLESLFVPAQVPGGTDGDFSVMAYPLPRLRLEERQRAALRDTESIDALVLGAKVCIDLDNFGQINWIYVSGYPNLHTDIETCMQRLR